jgi:hypothetical protein
MNPHVKAAERAKQVRDAARAWHSAGFASDAVLARIISLYPDDRRRFGPGFRALAFIFTGVAVWAVFGLSMLVLEPSGSTSWGVLCLFWAAACVALTELQTGPGRRADAGAENATAYSAVALAVLSALAFADSVGLDSLREYFIVALAAGFVCCLSGAARWGDRALSAGAALTGFGLLAQNSQGRLLWIIVALSILPIGLTYAREPRLSPSHRDGFSVLSGVATLALYAAVHIWSYDQRLIEGLRSYSPAPPLLPYRPFFILSTALLPPLLLILGWRRREPLLLYSGLFLIGVSITTIRLYHAVMPLSVALILIGSACLFLALGVRRWLRSGPAGERHGFTADPLFDDTNRTEAIRSVVAVATFTPAAQTTPSRPAFEGGGGSFGGGGASGGY